MSEQENLILQGSKKFNKEIADAVEVSTIYCKECAAYHVSKSATFEWDEEEMKLGVDELEKRLTAGTLKAPKEEAENLIKFYKAVKVRRLL